MNEMSVKGHDLNEMCRLCLKKDTGLLDIFCFSDEISNQLSNVIMTFAPVQIKRHDEMPSSICRLCYTQLKNIHNFQVQIVESDKTLRLYLQQLHTSGQQIKPELSIQNSSEDHIIQKTNNSDITEKPIVFHDIFASNLTNNEVAPLNCNSAIKLNEEIPLKSEIKDEPTDDNSLDVIDCADETVETLSKGGGSACEDSEADISYYSKTTNKINQDGSIEFKIKIEPANDNSSNLIECADDIVETVFNTESEICSENLMINRGHTSGNNFAECSGKSQEKKEHIAGNYENQKKATEKKYLCDICNKSFINSFTLKIHTRIHTSEKPYQCDVCNICFSRSDALSYHKRTHTGEKPYQCDVCNMCFSRSDGLNRHKRTHTGEKPYECNFCNKCFSESSNLYIHKRIHTGEKPYQCDVCNKNFATSTHLNNHRRTHTGEKPYQCDVCNKSFTISNHLITHKRTHTGEKPYQCDVCNKFFSQFVSLNKHKRTHTGEKPYQCDVCNINFSRSCHLITHKRTHTGEKPYQCEICNKCFNRSGILKRHKRIHTDVKPSV